MGVFTSKHTKEIGNLSDNELALFYTSTGEEIYFTALYKRNYKRVFRHCQRYIKDHELARDFTQAIFLLVYEKIEQFRHQSNFTNWLSVLTRNYCMGQLRLYQRKEEAAANWAEEQLIEETDDQTFALMDKALSKLPEADRELLNLKYTEGMSIRELCEYYKATPGSIKMRLLRIRNQVALYTRKQLNK